MDSQPDNSSSIRVIAMVMGAALLCVLFVVYYPAKQVLLGVGGCEVEVAITSSKRKIDSIWAKAFFDLKEADQSLELRWPETPPTRFDGKPVRIHISSTTRESTTWPFPPEVKLRYQKYIVVIAIFDDGSRMGKLFEHEYGVGRVEVEMP